MSIDEIEAEALKLDPKARARLAACVVSWSSRQPAW